MSGTTQLPEHPSTPLLSSPDAMATPTLVRVGDVAEPLPAAVADLAVTSVHDGNSVPLASVWSQQRSIVLFVRHWM